MSDLRNIFHQLSQEKVTKLEAEPQSSDKGRNEKAKEVRNGKKNEKKNERKGSGRSESVRKNSDGSSKGSFWSRKSKNAPGQGKPIVIGAAYPPRFVPPATLSSSDPSSSSSFSSSSSSFSSSLRKEKFSDEGLGGKKKGKKKGRLEDAVMGKFLPDIDELTANKDAKRMKATKDANVSNSNNAKNNANNAKRSSNDENEKKWTKKDLTSRPSSSPLPASKGAPKKEQKKKEKKEKEGMASIRKAKFEKAISATNTDLKTLRSLAWKGVPCKYRATVWRLLLEYLPTNSDRRRETLKRKRKEYFDCFSKYIDVDENDRTEAEVKMWKQIDIDMPRTHPNLKLFQDPETQRYVFFLFFVVSSSFFSFFLFSFFFLFFFLSFSSFLSLFSLF